MGLFNRKKSSAISQNFVVQNSVVVKRDIGSAVSLEKVKNSGINLVKNSELSAKALNDAGLLGIRGKAILLLDHSRSMIADYSNGSVQTLTERALAYMLQFSSTQSVLVIPFDSKVYEPLEVNLDNYSGIVEQRIWKRYDMSSTVFSSPLRQVLDLAKTTDELIYLVVVTDGNPDPDDREETTQLVCELASYPVFIKFVALGTIPYLQKLDDLDDTQRLLDNVDAKFFPKIDSITDQQFVTAMVEEFGEWIELATSAGILRK